MNTHAMYPLLLLLLLLLRIINEKVVIDKELDLLMKSNWKGKQKARLGSPMSHLIVGAWLITVETACYHKTADNLAYRDWEKLYAYYVWHWDMMLSLPSSYPRLHYWVINIMFRQIFQSVLNKVTVYLCWNAYRDVLCGLCIGPLYNRISSVYFSGSKFKDQNLKLKMVSCSVGKSTCWETWRFEFNRVTWQKERKNSNCVLNTQIHTHTIAQTKLTNKQINVKNHKQVDLCTPWQWSYTFALYHAVQEFD